ncbi:hypothetical protein DENIS_2279 [Desulfonema ishimotonii]|uniref:PKD domain-containing protein n=1 Tax=Desulfonema ishimotonii TaxID=45657 RepID=A0A401FWK1_9BACT|nr:PKD domain-containing protein [Desulfonema ishimotonii]GBC61319.1 hypothetical protein DENIS_2279 [Desulfonema ishimotonii]
MSNRNPLSEARSSRPPGFILARVIFYVTRPGTPEMKIGETLISTILVGAPDFGSCYVYTTWKNHLEGVYIVEAEIDPGYPEDNHFNNAATRAIIVGQLQGYRGVVAGQVSDPRRGVANVPIALSDSDGSPVSQTLTDDTGYYLVEDVPPDEYRIHITTPDGYMADAETRTAVVSDQTPTEVDFYLRSLAPPMADAGGPYAGRTGSQVTLDASGSDDPDGQIVSYDWDCNGDGIYEVTTSSPTVTHSWDSEFSGVIQLKVTDNDGLVSTDEASVEITDCAPREFCCDLDRDSDCDANDYDLFINAYGKSPNDQGYMDKADYDEDHIISLTDFRQWYQCYWDYQGTTKPNTDCR